MNEMDTRFANQYNIQWFPGHMTKTLRMMEQEIQHVDASLVLLDARIPLSSLRKSKNTLIAPSLAEGALLDKKRDISAIFMLAKRR